MLRILKFLITGDWHLHEWDEGQSIVVQVKKKRDDMFEAQQGQAVLYIQSCKKCGIKRDFIVRNRT